jgi:hypothetical protein
MVVRDWLAQVQAAYFGPKGSVERLDFKRFVVHRFKP